MELILHVVALRLRHTFTIAHGTLDVQYNLIVERREYPDFPVYKIKLGTPDDRAIVRARRAVTSATFRVDAQQAHVTRAQSSLR